MAIDELYSNRNKTLPDLYTYDTLPKKLKNQIVHIWDEFYNQIEDSGLTDEIWETIETKLSKRHGEETLLVNSWSRFTENYKVEWYFKNTEEVEKCLDVIELVFRIMINIVPHLNKHYRPLKFLPDEAINDLNSVFLENGVGYEFNGGQIIKVNSKHLHENVVQPTLLLLGSEFENADEEYRSAHENFRHHRNKDCLNDCLKAFESTMKILCHKNSWQYDENDTASKLISILISNNFLPHYHGTQLNAIKQVLESGVPTVRNKKGAHGQGINKIVVDDSLASYMLYITGSTLKFLLEIQKDNEPNNK